MAVWWGGGGAAGQVMYRQFAARIERMLTYFRINRVARLLPQCEAVDI